jgi:hypothetical protein
MVFIIKYFLTSQQLPRACSTLHVQPYKEGEHTSLFWREVIAIVIPILKPRREPLWLF